MKTALALGTFDGVHKGHRAVLDLPNNYKKIAVVFAVPPRAVMSGERYAIMTPGEKCRVLKKIGIDEVVLLHFKEIRDITADEFLNYIKCTYSPSLISCGFNYSFGKNAVGDKKLLESFCQKNGIEFLCSPPVCKDGVPVSSTAIRTLLKNGEIEKANSLLSEPFSYSAEVISGDKRGRTIGFPTINQKYPEIMVDLKYGVYKSAVFFDGKKYTGVTNIGIRPTFKSDYIISETYIKNFSGDIYGKTVTVSLLEFIRGEVKFSSAEELARQIKRDADLC